MPTNNPTGENQQTQKDDRKGQLGGGQSGSGGKQGGASQGRTSGKDNPGNFANDREKASEAGRKGGQHS